MNGGSRDPDRLPPFIRPAVDFIARIRATVHTKLLAGFLVIAVLLVAMGITSILVIRRMNQEAQQLISSRSRPTRSPGDLRRDRAEPLPGDGAHHQGRLLQRQDRSREGGVPRPTWTPWGDGRAGRQATSTTCARSIERYAEAGDEVLALYDAGEFVRALDLHISAEHEISHELEDELNVLIDSTEGGSAWPRTRSPRCTASC